MAGKPLPGPEEPAGLLGTTARDLVVAARSAAASPANTNFGEWLAARDGRALDGRSYQVVWVGATPK